MGPQKFNLAHSEGASWRRQTARRSSCKRARFPSPALDPTSRRCIFVQSLWMETGHHCSGAEVSGEV